MQANRIKFERLNELVVWLAGKANTYSKNVTVMFMENGEIRLKVITENEIEHGLKYYDGTISYHTKQYITI